MNINVANLRQRVKSSNFSLADEAARTLALIEKSAENVHLVGHVALAKSDRIAGLALYEPSAFHLLPQMVQSGAAAYAEIAGVAWHMWQGVLHGAISAFVDYWNGSGVFDAMRPQVQNALIRWTPNCPLDFRALIQEPTPRSSYRSLNIATLILRSQHSQTPHRKIAEDLSRPLPAARHFVINGAGRMGSITHAPEVCRLMVEHIGAIGNGEQAPGWHPRSLAIIFGAALQPAKAVP